MPADEGVNTVPVTPVPEKVPMAGVPDKNKTSELGQNCVCVKENVTTGAVFTVEEITEVEVQPLVFVYV